MIEKLHVRNFKSLVDCPIDLAPLSVFVGPNACGKSNLIDALRFIRDALGIGLTQAIDVRGGIEAVTSKVQEAGKDVAVTISGTLPQHEEESTAVDAAPRDPPAPPVGFSYEFTFGPDNGELAIDQERLVGNRSPGAVSEDVVVIKRDRDFLRLRPRGAMSSLTDEELYEVGPANRTKLAAGVWYSDPIISALMEYTRKWHFYDVDPRAARSPVPEKEVGPIAENGLGLPAALYALRRDAGERDFDPFGMMMDYLRRNIPLFDSLNTDKSHGLVSFEVLETHLRSGLSAGEVSDGTVALMAYLAALLYGSPEMLSIEEPERYLHPHLLEELVDFFRHLTSFGLQVVMTTHSVELVNRLRPDEVFLMDKGEKGTAIVRASDKDHIEAYLKEFSLGDLWYQGQLGGVPE